MIEINLTKENTNPSILCACKGIRKCAICAPSLVLKEKYEEETLLFNGQNNEKKLFIYCIKCDQSIPLNESIRKEIDIFINELDSSSSFNCYCKQIPENEILKVKGIFVTNEFVSSAEESYLFEEINKTPWVDSQSGRYKQDYGPQANFNKKKLKYNKFTGLPHYSKFIFDRFNSFNLSVFENFNPVELCNLKYEPQRASCIDPHYDDFWLWGDRLITLNLLSNTFLSLTPDPLKIPLVNNCEILIPLRRLSLNVINDDARNKWFHSIKKGHIKSTRVAITFRELSEEFKADDQKGKLGREIEKIAVTFTGISTGYMEELLKEEANLEASNINLEFNDTIKNCIHDQFDLNSFKILKQNKNKLTILSKEHIIKILSSNEVISNNLLEIQTKINNEFVNNNNLKFHNIINESQSLNVCIQNYIEIKNELLENLDVLFYIGMQIAQWRELSTRLFEQEICLTQFNNLQTSINNFLLIHNDFDAYKKLMINKLNHSKFDFAFKCKSIAIVIDTQLFFKDIETNSSAPKGLILNDFKPKALQIINKDKILCLTSFQNINYTYFLNDLALCIVDMIVWLVLKGQSWENAMLIGLMNGYQTKFKLNSVELKLLDRLIILNLVLKIIELVELNLEKFYFDKLVEIFDNSYKNPNYILNKIK